MNKNIKGIKRVVESLKTLNKATEYQDRKAAGIKQDGKIFFRVGGQMNTYGVKKDEQRIGVTFLRLFKIKVKYVGINSIVSSL